MLKNIFLIFAFTSLHHHHLTESYSVGGIYGNLRRFVENSQALKYGDSCSWEAEETRQNYSRRLLAGDRSQVLHMADYFVEKDYKLCSGLSLFVCDKESQKCVCGTPVHEILHGVDRSKFFLEGNKCRWNTGTYCLSAEEFVQPYQALMRFNIDSRCRSQTTCKTGSGEVCTKAAMIRYILNNYGFWVIMDQRRLKEELMSGRVCSCKANQIATTETPSLNWWSELEEDDAPTVDRTTTTTTTVAPSDSGENSVNNWLESDEEESYRRRKRSVLEDEKFGIGIIAKYMAGPEAAVFIQ